VIFYLAVPLTLFIIVLQVAAAPSFTYLTVHADLVVVWLGCWAVIRGRNEVMVLIPVAGIGLGLLGREPLGTSLLALMPIAALAALYEMRPIRARFLTTIAIVFAASLLYTCIHALAGFAGGEPLGQPLDVVRVAPRAAVLDAMVAAVWYWPLRVLFSRRARGGEFRRA